MKILIIIGSFKVGGAERMSINTGEELIKRGYDVYFILQKPIFEIPNSIPENKIFVLRKKNNQSAIYKMYALFWGVFMISRKIKPDRVIAFSRFSSFLSCFTFNKYIIARFDMNPYKLSRKQHRWANYVVGFPFVKKIIVPSNGMLKALRAEKPDYLQKFAIISNSIKSNEVVEKVKSVSPLQKYNFDYISAMGRLSKQKNFELLITGYSKSKINNKYKLVIVGDGNLKSNLAKIVQQLNLEDKVIFTGQLTNPFPIIANSMFFVNTSIHESFCNVILEAMTLSKPVIATDCEYGPADMVINKYNGFLIDNNNLNELVEKLDILAGDENLISAFATNAKEVAKQFDIEHIGDEWEKVLNN